MDAPRAARTRSRILSAAAAGFAEHGYDATGVEEICRQAPYYRQARERARKGGLEVSALPAEKV